MSGDDGYPSSRPINVHYAPTASGQEDDNGLVIARRRERERVDSAEFGSSEHNREKHWTAEADDEIAEVPPTKFALGPRSPPNAAATELDLRQEAFF